MDAAGTGCFVAASTIPLIHNCFKVSISFGRRDNRCRWVLLWPIVYSIRFNVTLIILYWDPVVIELGLWVFCFSHSCNFSSFMNSIIRLILVVHSCSDRDNGVRERGTASPDVITVLAVTIMWKVVLVSGGVSALSNRSRNQRVFLHVSWQARVQMRWITSSSIRR